MIFSLFKIDTYSLVYALLVLLIGILVSVYSIPYLSLRKVTIRQRMVKFYLPLSLSLIFSLCIGFSGNLIVFFIFYQLLSLSTLPLVNFWGDKESISAGKIYFNRLFIGGFILILPAIIIVYILTGTTNFVDGGILNHANTPKWLASILLILFTVGIAKNAIMPFHYWLPKTAVSPAPISALIHSVAGVKASIIITLKVMLYIFGLNYIQELTDGFLSGGWIIYLCGLNAVYTAFLAWKTNDIKERLIYSTVGQMSYIIAIFLIGTEDAIFAGMIHMVTHSISKTTLFLIAGGINTIYFTKKANIILQIAKYHKVIMSGFIISGFSIIGIPFSAGSISKELMLSIDFNTHHYISLLLLIIGSFINILYIFPISKATFFNHNLLESRIIVRRKLPLLMSGVIMFLTMINISISIAYIIWSHSFQI